MNYLFVYGTLRKEFDNSAAKYLHANSEYIGNGFFYGSLYHLGAYPGAIENKSKNAEVFGSIFLLKNPNRILKYLDNYEGVGLKNIEPNEYIRKRVSVYGSVLQELQCWVYLYNNTTAGLALIESGDYLKK